MEAAVVSAAAANVAATDATAAGDDEEAAASRRRRQRTPRLAAALSLALCTANRARTGYDASMNTGVVAGGVRASLQVRLAVLAAAPDADDAYVAVMNAAFAAARADVRVDAVL
ncbi:hypothetical protein MMPV_007021, partial [Pyropia vietnamensis]